jgi:hypothetical protein
LALASSFTQISIDQPNRGEQDLFDNWSEEILPGTASLVHRLIGQAKVLISYSLNNQLLSLFSILFSLEGTLDVGTWECMFRFHIAL